MFNPFQLGLSYIVLWVVLLSGFYKANTLGVKVMTGLTAFVRITRKRHGFAMRDAHDPEKTMAWRIDDACGGWQDELRDLAKVTQTSVALREGGFMPAGEDASEVESLTDKDHALVIHRFLWNLLSARTSPPP